MWGTQRLRSRKDTINILGAIVVPLLIFAIKLVVVDWPEAKLKQAVATTAPSSPPTMNRGAIVQPQLSVIRESSERGVLLKVETPYEGRYHYLVVQTDGGSPFVQGPLGVVAGVWRGSPQLGDSRRKISEFFVHVIAVRQSLPAGYPEVPQGPGVASSGILRITQKKEN